MEVGATLLLIDKYLPKWDVRERHSIVVPAPLETTYAAIMTADLAHGTIVRSLLLLRALPAALLRRRTMDISSARREAVTLAAFEQRGFRVLEECRPDELVIGLEGKFWTMDGCLKTPDADAFRSIPPAPGSARAVWNFRIEEIGVREVRLSTETRVLCADRKARIRFLAYWTIVRPGSGLIRRAMLRAIRDVATGRNGP